MEKITDEITVYAICVAIMIWQLPTAGSEIATLAFIAISLICTLIKQPTPRAAVEISALVLCVAIPSFTPFLPTIAYLCMTEKQWWLRFSWIVAWAANALLSSASNIGALEGSLLAKSAAISEPFALSMAVLLACSVASVLAIRTNRLIIERRSMREARDDLREHSLELAKRNRKLIDELNSAEAKANNTNITSQQEIDRLERFDGLTDREHTIVALIAQGLDNREIACQLYLSEGTVRNNISSILQKKHLKNRTQIAVMYYCG